MEWAEKVNFDTEKLFIRTNSKERVLRNNTATNDSTMQRINVISDEVPMKCVLSYIWRCIAFTVNLLI